MEENGGSVTLPRPSRVKSMNKRSPFGALLSRSLPAYTGQHPSVGVADIELPIGKQSFGSFAHAKMPKAEAGLHISSVLFTLYYPCEKPEKKEKAVWFPAFAQTIDGFLRMASRVPNFLYRSVAYPAAAAAIYGTTFPASKNAQLLEPPKGGKWRLLIFSHGVGCSRLMYSAYLGEMASRGYIVAAIEHRDGTGPSSTIVAEDGSKRVLDWLQWSDLTWPELEEQPKDDTTLRHVQIDVRLAEMEAVIKIMNQIAKGATPYSIVGTIDWSRWARYIDPSRPTMSGHSFGGTAALAAVNDKRFDFSQLIVSDPAVQRLAPWTGRIPIPLLSINSEEFVFSSDHDRLIAMCKTAAKPPILLSVVGSTHPSYSDVFIIVPNFIGSMTGLKVDAETVVEHFVNATEDALTDQRDVLLTEARAIPAGTKLRKPLGKPGELLWHQLAP